MSRRPAALSLLACAALAAAARADLSFSLVDTGAPRVPTYMDPSGFLPGYTAYILRVVSDSDTPGTYSAINPIRGSFAQVWTASPGHAGVYNSPSPGILDARNTAPDLWNLDSHFLGNPLHGTTIEMTETAAFSPSDPLAAFNSPSHGFGTGTSLTGSATFWLEHRTSTLDIAYLVVPTGSPITFTDIQVVTTTNKGYLISSPQGAARSTWSNPDGGAWNDVTNWAGVTRVGSYEVVAPRAVPLNPGDTADFTGTFTPGATVTLDGNKTLARLTFAHAGSLLIAPGTGGSLTLANGDKSFPLALSGGTTTLATPLFLASPLSIARSSDFFTPPGATPTLFLAGAISSPDNPALSLRIGRDVDVTLAADNDYAGPTTVSGHLVIGNGGTTGSLGKGPVTLLPQPSSPALTFNRDGLLVVPNPISGTGILTNLGAGTLVLTGHLDINGNISQNGPGTLHLAGPLSTTPLLHQNGPGRLLIDTPLPAATTLLVSQGAATLVNPAPPADPFQLRVVGPFTPALTRRFTAPAILTNHGLTAIGTTVLFRAGITSTPVDIIVRAQSKYSHTSARSDVVELTMTTPGGAPLADVFTLELSYALDYPFYTAAHETDDVARAALVLASRDLANPSTWFNATARNAAVGNTRISNYQGAWAAFAAANNITDATLGAYLGSWGVDTTAKRVWAVLDHPGHFAAVSLPPPPVTPPTVDPPVIYPIVNITYLGPAEALPVATLIIADFPAGATPYTSEEWQSLASMYAPPGPNAVTNFQGSFADFAIQFTIDDTTLPALLGSWGTTPAGGWALQPYFVDHGGSEPSIPEPATLLPLTCGLAACLLRRRRGLQARPPSRA